MFVFSRRLNDLCLEFKIFDVAVSQKNRNKNLPWLSLFTKIVFVLLFISNRNVLIFFLSVSYLPWDPQSKSHNLELQSSPTQPSKQSHFWASRSKTPWPEQSGRHCLASSSKIPQSRPFQPFLQIQEPSTQNPCSEQVGSGQSTFWQKSPVNPFIHWHWPSSHRPRPVK